jgi:hypothetical protein
MKKPLKWTLGLLGGLVTIIVLALIIGLLFINGIARRGIQSGATYALGVETQVSSVSIGLVSGRMGLSGLRVANPQGYTSPHFVTLGDGKVEVSLGSLSQDTIQIPELRLSDVDLVLERHGGKANYDVILANIERVAGGKSKPRQEPGPDKKLVIGQLLIRNVTVHADLLGVPGEFGAVANQVASITIPIDEIRLQNVGKTGSGVGGSGITVAQLSGLVIEAILAAAVEKGGGVLPPDVVNGIKGGLANLGSLGGQSLEVIGGTVQEATKAAGQAGQVAGETLKRGQEEVQKLGEGLKDLLGGKK